MNKKLMFETIKQAIIDGGQLLVDNHTSLFYNKEEGHFYLRICYKTAWYEDISEPRANDYILILIDLLKIK